ncbi:MAG: YihY/virulence factor BrkB family protein [Chloroflexota bacterium]
MIKFMRAFGALFRETFDQWSRTQPGLHAAALAFATLFSLAPLLVLTLVIVGQVFEARVLQSIVDTIASAVGSEAAHWVYDLIANRRNAPSDLIATLIGLVVLISGASGLVLQLQASLNAMWRLTAKPNSTLAANLLSLARQRIVSGLIALGIGVMLLGVLLLNTLGATFYEAYAQPWLTTFGVSAPHDPAWTAPLVYCLTFAVMFRVLPEATTRWRDLLPGAALTGLLFWVASFAVRVYLALGFTASLYGAAASVIVLLLWINYSALIVLFGAAFTRVYARKFGVPIVPRPHMMVKADEPQIKSAKAM